MQELGALNRLEVRSIWKHEAGEFTPWLAKNLDQLGSVLGLDLELQQTEMPVGSFSADILANDAGSNRTVVIENQLEPTNHKHLGQLITYAAGQDAGIVVWVSPEVREEHRQALDWLNHGLGTDIDFFAVAVEVLTIGDSRPAANFRLVASPNDWGRRRWTGLPSGATPKEQRYQSFFQALIDVMREKHRFTNARRAQPAGWYSFAAGVSGVSYSAVFSNNKRFRVELWLGASDADLNQMLFDGLLPESKSVEREFGEPLDWQALDGKKACRIAIYRDGAIEESDEKLAELRVWAVERLLKMKEVFGPRIREIAAGQATGDE